MSEIKFHDLVDGTEPCNTDDPEKWTGEWTAYARPEDARMLCSGCHIIEQCLEYALEHDEQLFIYGGTTPAERKKIAARRRRANRRIAKDTEQEGSSD